MGRSRLVLGLAAAAGGCALHAGSLPPEAGPALTVEPAGPPATWYMSPGPPAVPDGDPVRRLVADAVATAAVQAGVPVPARDVRLDRVADDMARAIPTDRCQPSLELAAFLLGHYGVVEPEPDVFCARAGAKGERQLADSMRGEVASALREESYSRVGIGVLHGDDLIVVLALQNHHLDLHPIPRALAAGLVAEVEGRLLDGYRQPQLYVTAPHGEVAEVRMRRTGASFEAAIGCRRDQPGAYQLEIFAERDRGPEVLANFPVYCAVDPPGRSPPLPLDSGQPEDPAWAEREIYALVSKERKARGLSPLRLDRRLSDVARAYSAEMASTGVVAHVSPRSGNVLDRVKRVGLSPALIAENVARADSAAQAHRSFMSSPGHRSNIIDPGFTGMGIGVAAGPSEGGSVPLFVTEIFTDGL